MGGGLKFILGGIGVKGCSLGSAIVFRVFPPLGAPSLLGTLSSPPTPNRAR